MTVAETLKAAREFYTRRRKKWGTGALHDDGTYCVLGAISAVVTNEDRIKRQHYNWPRHDFKNIELIEQSAKVLKKALGLEGRGKWAPIFEWNDEVGRSDIIAGLRKAEDLARERGL